jgi:hypothetical protein
MLTVRMLWNGDLDGYVRSSVAGTVKIRLLQYQSVPMLFHFST